MSLFNPQQMMINFLKGLGINEELIVGKMNEFQAIVNAYRQEVATVNRRLDIIEQNIALICEKLEISTKPEIDKIRLVTDNTDAHAISLADRKIAP